MAGGPCNVGSRAGKRFEEAFLEQWLAPLRPMLEQIILLAVANGAHFAEQIEKVTELLRRCTSVTINVPR